MNPKERYYSGVARETIHRITANRENWASFLATMARNYDFTYPEQVMIYAQRPNATLCKPYEEWNTDQYRRYVKRGSTGIALFVMNQDKPYLRYVFDVADTGVRRSSPSITPWRVTDENRRFIMDEMERVFQVPSEGILEYQLENIAINLAREYWDDFKKPILDIVADSFLEEYDEYNIEVAFKTAVANSVSYAMYSRITENPDNYFEHEDFQNVFDFNTRQTVNALGTAVNAVSSRMFGEIEKAIEAFEQTKTVERSHDYERNDLHTGRGLPDSGHRTEEHRNETVGQVRQNAEGVSAREQSDVAERSDSQRAAVPASPGDRRDSAPQSGAADDRTAGEESGTGQSNTADGMGEAHEQPESTGRGNRDSGAYQQLSLNLFLSESEQISFIDEAESKTLSAFSLSENQIDQVLTVGGNEANLRMMVALEYMKGKSTEEIAKRLPALYRGSNGFKLDSHEVSAWFDEQCIHLARGKTARFAPSRQIVSWQEAAERIGKLLENGEYATNVELVEAPGYERTKVAESLWYLYHDLSDNAREQGFFPSLQEVRSVGFPAETAELAEKLNDSQFRAGLKAEYQNFLQAHNEDSSLLRFHYHKLERLAQRLDELDLPLREYQSSMTMPPLVRQFITDDEINESLSGGSGFSGGKARIYEYWQKGHSAKEKADFLKNEYGTGGRSHALSGASGSGEDHDAKGIRYTKSGCDKVQLSWTQVANRIDSLIKQERYISPEVLKDVQQERASDIENEPNPVGRIEYLGTNGRPGEVIEYTDPEQFIKNIEDETFYGVPFTVVLYRDEQGNTIPQDFLSELDPPPKGFRVEDAPVIDLEEEAPSVDEAEESPFVAQVMRDVEAIAAEEESYERFSVIETENGYAVWDDIRDEIYVDDEGVSEEFTSEWQANDYLQEVKKAVSAKESAEWLYNERSKFEATQEPVYQVGDTVFLEGEAYNITAIGTTDVQLLPPGMVYPIYRAESKENFERLLRQDERNARFISGEEPEKTVATAEPEHFIDHYYVVEDLQVRGALQLKEYSTFEDAMRAYKSLPSERMKALGVQNTRTPFPGSLDLIQCKDGEDKLVQDYTKVAGWENPEILDLVQKIETAIQTKESPDIPAINFHITNDHLGEGGAKAKFRANMDAIRVLKELEFDERNATPEEQEILSQYVGWGGLAAAFDENKASWAEEFRELYTALSPEEYAAARASTLNAHYTSPTVIRAIYDAVGQMGFETGNILEPAMGIGNFFGMLPDAMRNSNLYGVELDSISGRIAQKLYPNAEIKVAGFETTDRRDFYDLAVGNVPFGNYKVSDKPYDKLGFSIHNYFFAKTLDQVRPGGVVAFVTSRFTMDSKNSDARKYMAQRAELLGAIRLPNTAFKANAGTEVVSDIIFLQKRDHPIDIMPDWVQLNTTPDGYTMNSYFVEHPEMVLGELSMESTQYGKDDLTVRPREDMELADLLREAVTRIGGTYAPAELTEEANSQEKEQITIPARPDVKNFSYTVVDDEVYFRENSVMRLVELNDKAKERVSGMVELRRIVNELIEYQLEDYPDDMIQAKQVELNAAYDAFTAKNGLINNRANSQAFADDSSYYLLCSLENLDEDGHLKSKADMFTKRTIKPERKVNSVDTPSEALAISIGEHGKVDLPYMAELLGTPGEYDSIKTELQGVIFKDPMAPDDPVSGWQTADEYLSGDVRSKLRIAQMAAQKDSSFEINVQALEKAQPKDLDASEIDVRLGATWIDSAYIQQFMQETFETPYYLRRTIEVKFSELTAEWRINGKSSPSQNDVAAYTTYGTERANAYRILEETLNLKDIRIYDTIEDADGKQKRVLNKKETTLAQQKQQAIKDAFRDWIWKDSHRREALVTKYNELFNSTRPREYDGSHIRFGGMNPDITLREHQRNAIAHVLYFDCWASTFGETTTAIELAPEGTGYRARTRFAKFFNLPELMNMFKEVADIKTSDQLHLPVPDAKFETVVVQPSDYQQDMVADLSERAAAVHSGMVDPSEDNMLKITGDGRKLGLDQRLINPLLPDDPESKLNACVQNVLRIWEEGKADRLTQLLFCDLSTPKNDGTFNVYDDIKAKLIATGVPEKEIAFIHDADSEAKKKELFAKVRTGQVRVLMGSTQKMGAGTNCQDRLVALHHLDVGWRPSDMTQRNGRIIRQGNQNKEVQIYQYVTEGTFDAYLYQTLENKQKFISQIMTSKSPVRSCDDVDEQALSYAEIKALCAGNPLIKEKMDLDIDVARLKVLKADHQSQQYRMEDKLLKYFPAEIERQTGYIRGFEADIQTVTTHPQIVEGFCGMEILGKHYMEKEDAGEMILAACKEMKATEPIPLGSYRGFQMELSFDSFRHDFDITLKGAVSHRVSLGTDARGNIIRLDNALSSIPEKLEKAHEQLTNLQNQQEATRAELGKPFPQEAELAEKSARLAELDAALNMEDSMPEREEAEQADKPSVLADLKAKSEHIPPYRASGGREEVL